MTIEVPSSVPVATDWLIQERRAPAMSEEQPLFREHTIHSFEASDGYQYQYRHWQPTQSSPRAYIVMLHGIQSHSGWYTYSCDRLCQEGYDIRFLDRRGSGLNQEQRGHVLHPERLVGDITQFLADLHRERKRRNFDAPIFLMSVSWGGKLAVVTAARRPDLVEGLALLYPGICARIKPKWNRVLKLKYALWKGWVNARVNVPLGDPALFTHDPLWQKYINDDPLTLHRVSVGFLGASRELDKQASELLPQINCPLLLMLAGQDRIIDNDATRKLFEKVPSQQRTLIEYPEAAHTLEFEKNRDQFVKDLADWLNIASTSLKLER